MNSKDVITSEKRSLPLRRRATAALSGLALSAGLATNVPTTVDALQAAMLAVAAGSTEGLASALSPFHPSPPVATYLHNMARMYETGAEGYLAAAEHSMTLGGPLEILGTLGLAGALSRRQEDSLTTDTVSFEVFVKF